MRKLTLIALLFAAILTGCTKNYYGDDQTYHIDGITNITLNANQPSRNMFLQVTYQGSDQESVELTLENVPAGLSTRIVNPSGYPSFTSQVYFYDSSAAVGNYTVNLVATGTKSGRRILPFKVTIEQVPDCGAASVGTWDAYNPCSSGSSYFTESISASGTANRIVFNNFESSGVSVYATVNCARNTFVVPSQTINGVTYSGSGTFILTSSPGDSYMQLSYTKSAAWGTTSCQEYLQR